MIEKKKMVKIKKSVSIKKGHLERISKKGNVSKAIDLAIEKVYGKYDKVATKVAFFNQKGGVAKTVSTFHLAEGVAAAGKKVLIVDLDKQANLTKTYGQYCPDSPSTYSLLFGDTPYKECIKNVKENIDIVPANIKLSNFDRRDSAGIKEFMLKDALNDIDAEGYDFIFVDCSPSLDKVALNALSFVDKIYIPIQPENYALDGVNDLLDTIKITKQRFQNPHLYIAGVFCTLVDLRSKDHKEIMEQVEKTFGNKMLETKVRRSADVVSAIRHGQTVFEHSTKTRNGFKDYTALVKEFLAIEEGVEA